MGDGGGWGLSSFYLAPVFVAVAYSFITAFATSWMPLLVLLTGGMRRGPQSGSASCSSRSAGGHQTVHVNVEAVPEDSDQAVKVVADPDRTNCHTLPLIYALATSALLWVSLHASVDEGAVMAVAAASAVAVLFIAKLADRCGSGHLCVLMVTSAALAGQTAVLASSAVSV